MSGICYCNSLKRKLKSKNAGEVYEKIVHFIMTVSDINPLADVADTDSLLHISSHQSIPGHYKLVINTSLLSLQNNAILIRTIPRHRLTRYSAIDNERHDADH